MPKRPGAGRKPIPLEKRRAMGAKVDTTINGKRVTAKVDDLSPVLVGGRPEPGEDFAIAPEWLPADAKEAWNRDVQKIIEVGIADRIDHGALEALCVCYARAKQSGRVVASEGLFIQAQKGQLREHPAVKIERDAWNQYLRLAEQFGITPIARTRLGIAELGRRTLAHDLADRLGMPTFTVDQPAQNPEGPTSGQVYDEVPQFEPVIPDAELVGD